MGATPEQAERAVVTLVASLLGMICDGAKETCSLKVATAACEAYSAAALAIKGGGVHDVQGMVAPHIKELGGILAQFSQRILGSADNEMAQIMLQHH
jgi:L-cysteine desulfidase